MCAVVGVTCWAVGRVGAHYPEPDFVHLSFADYQGTRCPEASHRCCIDGLLADTQECRSATCTIAADRELIFNRNGYSIEITQYVACLKACRRCGCIAEQRSIVIRDECIQVDKRWV